MSELLGPKGTLAAMLPNYEDRPQQREMAAAVGEALATDRSLIIEAGTGTGKTFAYLVPALESGKRVVISTGTRTLQEQIARHDLPRLEEILGRRVNAVTLKGVSNYVCRRRLASFAAQEAVDNGASEPNQALSQLLAWTGRTTTGDRADQTALPDNAAIWKQVTTTSDARLGPRCPYFERCFVTRARRAAEDAELVLVNHHLFFADLALRTAQPGARVLPEFEAVIFDEAHQLEDVITEHMGVQVSTARIASLLKELEARGDHDGPLFVPGRMTSALAEAARARAKEFFAAVGAQIQVIGGSGGAGASGDRVELPDELFARSTISEAWLDLDTALEEIATHLHLEAADQDNDQHAEALRGLSRQAERLRNDLASLAEGGRDGLVYWGEARAGSVSLRASPVEVDRIVRKHIAEQLPAIFTSATLSTEGGFGYIRDRLGLEEDLADAIALSSPFNYAEQALMYVARDMPEPRQPNFSSACAERVTELLTITEGRAFVLFTSHRMLAEVAARLRDVVPYPLLIQGQRSRAGILDAFRSEPGSVLLATGGFWEGVDVPGDALSHVIIDKLPFAPPNDPLVAARMRRIEERGDDAFGRYQVPQAALSLKQGIGRLIRRRDDRGLISILDSRIVTRGYGRSFLQSLPLDLPRTASIERARRWWTTP